MAGRLQHSARPGLNHVPTPGAGDSISIIWRKSGPCEQEQTDGILQTKPRMSMLGVEAQEGPSGCLGGVHKEESHSKHRTGESHLVRAEGSSASQLGSGQMEAGTHLLREWLEQRGMREDHEQLGQARCLTATCSAWWGAGVEEEVAWTREWQWRCIWDGLGKQLPTGQIRGGRTEEWREEHPGRYMIRAWSTPGWRGE